MAAFDGVELGRAAPVCVPAYLPGRETLEQAQSKRSVLGWHGLARLGRGRVRIHCLPLRCRQCHPGVRAALPSLSGRDTSRAPRCRRSGGSSGSGIWPRSFRPPRSTSSISTATPTMVAPRPSTRSQQAAMVPPVASRSSTISTWSPGWSASTWISTLSVPYSRAYSLARVAAGSRPRLADRHEAGGEVARHRRAEDEPARLRPDHYIHLLPAERLRQVLDRQRQAGRVAKQRCDVLEEDARLGIVGHVADQVAELGYPDAIVGVGHVRSCLSDGGAAPLTPGTRVRCGQGRRRPLRVQPTIGGVSVAGGGCPSR